MAEIVWDSYSGGRKIMATATGYNPMSSKMKIVKEPDEIFRCKSRDGNGYELYKTYSYKRRSRNLQPGFEIVKCNLDYPAEYIFGQPGTGVFAERNPNYELEMINYQLNKSNCNEYELRNLIMGYLKSKRKTVKTDMFKSVCSIFDKADKMLSKCDRRKNSNVYEADVSYSFLIKSYKKIVDMCEIEKVKKKVNSKKVKINNSNKETATQVVTDQERRRAQALRNYRIMIDWSSQSKVITYPVNFTV